MTLAVRVTPRASRTEVVGVQALPDGRVALALRLAAPPVDGEANAALIQWAAKALGVGRSAVTIAAGQTGRIKRVHVAGNGAALGERLTALARIDRSDLK